MPGQKSSGKKGASVVRVPASTGMKTSPAAIIADFSELILPLPSVNMRCVFSITTMASSTIIPSASKKENNVIKLSVNPIEGNTRKAIKLEIGTDIGIISYNYTALKQIAANGITTISTNFKDMGQKELAYEIKDFREGIYHIVKISASDAKAIDEFDRLAKINSDILRHIIVKEEAK